MLIAIYQQQQQISDNKQLSLPAKSDLPHFHTIQLQELCLNGSVYTALLMLIGKLLSLIIN